MKWVHLSGQQATTTPQKPAWWVRVLIYGWLPALIVAGVFTFRWVGQEYDDLRATLNDRYVEHIELRSEARGGGSYDTLIVVDGVLRRDCEEEDGFLTCTDDPQPTLEESAR